MHLRFESAETAARSKSDDELREELLRKLVDRELLGGTVQILLETNIKSLPLRELPPGNTSTLYMMYLSFMRQTGDPSDAASRSTFYSVAKLWRPCLRFRRKTEHALCFECSRLKTAIHKAKDSHLPLDLLNMFKKCWFNMNQMIVSSYWFFTHYYITIWYPWNPRTLDTMQSCATNSWCTTTFNGKTDSNTGTHARDRWWNAIYCAES